jgi:hypothetical protein
VELLAELGRDQREHHHRAGLGGLSQDVLDGGLIADAREEANSHSVVRELEEAGAHHSLGGLAGGVAHDEDLRIAHASVLTRVARAK